MVSGDRPAIADFKNPSIDNSLSSNPEVSLFSAESRRTVGIIEVRCHSNSSATPAEELTVDDLQKQFDSIATKVRITE